MFGVVVGRVICTIPLVRFDLSYLFVGLSINLPRNIEKESSGEERVF